MWKKSESATRPATVWRNNGTVYVRKNVTTKVVEDVTYYEYLENTMTENEYEQYANIDYIAMMTDVDIDEEV